MTVQQLIDTKQYEVVSFGERSDQKIEGVFCCDLLSIAMSKAPAGCAWVTVMANLNTLAVASLTEAAVIILAEGVRFDDETKKKASDQGITVLASEKPVFSIGKQIDDMLHETDLI